MRFVKEFRLEIFGKGNIADIHIIQLARDELLLESIHDALGSLKLNYGVILSAVGSLKKLVVHQPVAVENEIVKESIFTIEEPMEILSLSGTIMSGVPHFHITVSGKNRLYGGHLRENSVVLSIAEIVLAKIEGFSLERKIGPYQQRKLFEI
jgi:predicted DNA-binding protein with PD1-like motif